MALTGQQRVRKQETMRLWRQHNRNHVRTYKRLDYHRNRERINAARRTKLNTPEEREKARLRWARWYASPEGRKRHDDTVAIWCSRNIERVRAYGRASSKRHRAANMKRNRLWIQRLRADPVRLAKFKEQSRAWTKAYRAARKAIDPNYKLACGLRSRVSGLLRRCKAARAGRMVDLLDCSIQHLREHLESQFLEGMSWENYGLYGWHIDHIIPVTQFDLTDPEQQKACFHWTNLQPLWAADNLRKNNRLDWQKAA